jgi:hypothetical protein
MRVAFEARNRCYETSPLSQIAAILRFSRRARSRFPFRRRTRGNCGSFRPDGETRRSRSRCRAALLRASSRGGSEGGPTRSARKRPPIKIETPLGTPPFSFTSHRYPSVHGPVRFTRPARSQTATVATMQARGSTNAGDASVQNDSSRPQGPAGASGPSSACGKLAQRVPGGSPCSTSDGASS